jgi:hypothetical protein
MEEQKRKSISFIERLAFQIPTIILSSLTIIAISRNLGPEGRGEISQILLLSALTSSILNTPIFLTIMHLKESREIESFTLHKLFLFNRVIILSICAVNTLFFVINLTKDQDLSLTVILMLNTLIMFYFITSQLRDLLIRLEQNRIYFLDFAIQVTISFLVLLFYQFKSLSVITVILSFNIAYSAYSILLFKWVYTLSSEFRFRNIIRKTKGLKEREDKPKKHANFATSGLLFQLLLNKDSVICFLILTKYEFGLMSATASFWIVLRFFRTSAFIHAKLPMNRLEEVNDLSMISRIKQDRNLGVYLQFLGIGLLGLLAYPLVPMIMGSGFRPSLTMVILGLASEILLMRCLFDLSMSAQESKGNLIGILGLVQMVVLILVTSLGFSITIEVIWGSSVFIYALWFIGRTLQVSK